MTKKFYSVEDEMFDGHNNYESAYFDTFEEAKKYAMGLNPIAGGTHTVTEYEIEDDEDMDDMIGYVDGMVVFETKPVFELEKMSEEEFAKYLFSIEKLAYYSYGHGQIDYVFNINGTDYSTDFLDSDIDEYLESKGRSTEDVDYKKLFEAEEREILEYLIKENKDEIIKEIEKFGDK